MAIDPTCHHGIDGGCFTCTAGDTLQDMNERLLRSEQLNTRLARALRANEWHGGGSDMECPECGGIKNNGGHHIGCGIFLALKDATSK